MRKTLLLFLTIFSFTLVQKSHAQVLTPLDQGMQYLQSHYEEWGLTKADIDNVLVSDFYTNNKSGITYIYFNQSYNQIPVNNAITPLVIGKNGKVQLIDHRFIADLKSKIEGKTAKVQPLDAISAAVSHHGIKASSMPALLRSNTEKNIYHFGKADFSDNEIDVKLMYYPIDGKVRLAWSLAINETEGVDYYNTFVDAQTGAVLGAHNYTVKCQVHKGQFSKHKGCSKSHDQKAPIATFEEAAIAINAVSGTYNVFALPTESPIHGERTMEVDPFFPDASPFGWHDTNGIDGPEQTITRGNNVHAFLDKDNTTFSNDDEPDGGAELVFDLPYDVNNQADENEDASVVNLFYMNNMMHDITYRLGFDEQSGNFQFNNYGNGGNGGDYVIAQASDGIELATPTLNNANFSTPPDGSNGEMQMYLWENPSGILSIDEPESIAGFVNPVGTSGNATVPFGGPIPGEADAPISGKVVIARDASPSNPTTCCSTITNPDEVSGNIALIDRGLCDFSLKAFNAQEAGAISVIICNVVGAGGDGEEIINMNGGENASLVDIVPLFLRKSDCDRIRASILSDIDVFLTIQNRPPMGPTYLDAAVDNGVIAHEYGHGISTRLIGGPTASGCLTTDEQMGEGISDYFSLVTTVEEGDQGADPRGIGNYVDGQGTGGRGIRRFPYSTDFAINSLTYNDVKGTTSIYDLGEVWTVTLWEVYWEFVNAFGLDTSWENEESGNYKAVKLAIEGMKLVPCNPSLVDMRNGVLSADTLFYGGDNAELLWRAFARRGFGYLATDGGSSDDRNDGEESFEPLPLSIAELKVRKTMSDIVKAGEEVEVTLTAINHIQETQTNVVISDNIPENMTFVSGSSSIPAMDNGDQLVFELGDMAFKDEVVVTYRLEADKTINSVSIFLDDVENPDFSAYGFDATEGFNLWQQSFDISNSPIASWWASQTDTEVETDFYMDLPPMEVLGEYPVLRFWHRYDTEVGIDGGFILISNDNGIIYEDVKDKFIRNGYPLTIDYSTFAIPSLDGFTGSTNEKWVDSYLDLTEYKGQTVNIRFRFGTNETGGTPATNPGWFVDDLELIDLKAYTSFACITSNESEEQCSDLAELIVDTDEFTSTDFEIIDEMELAVAPNPASNYISVGLKAKSAIQATLVLSGIDGNEIKSQNLRIDENLAVRTFDVADLPAGMYLIQVRTKAGITTKKIVVQ